MNAAPPVRICLTTDDRGSVRPASIESLPAQEFGDFELIVSDDCSPDDAEEICRAYEARDPHVRSFGNATNLRMPVSLDAAIAGFVSLRRRCGGGSRMPPQGASGSA